MAKRVETEEEGRALIGTGGRWGQGYAISSPLSPENVPDWIGSWTPSPSWNKKRQGFPCLSLALDRGPALVLPEISFQAIGRGCQSSAS